MISIVEVNLFVGNGDFFYFIGIKNKGYFFFKYVFWEVD